MAIDFINHPSSESHFHLPSEINELKQKENLENESLENQDDSPQKRSQKEVDHKSPLHVFSTKTTTKSLIDKVKDIAETPIDANGDCLVCFYKSGPTEFLGNFADCPNGVTLWGQTFKCSEAAFQWRKYYLAAMEKNRPDLLADPNFEKFKTCTGEEAFKLRNYFDKQYPSVVVSGWSRHGIRDDVMWEVLNAKFSQNPELMDLLNATSGAYLMEHNNKAGKDDYWSDNHDGSGKNMLGKMLMALRDGKPQPKPHDSSDAAIIKAFADYANQPGALKYKIY